MVNTVAVYSPTGLVGKTLVPLLTALQKDGKINLVLIHRPSSDLSAFSLPSGADTRAIDFETETDDVKLLAAVKGIDLIISTAGFAAIASQLKLIETLAKSNHKTVFIPATFGAKLEGLPYPQIAGLAGLLAGYSTKAAVLGVSIANVHAGIFVPYFFALSAFKTDVKSNTVVADPEQLKNALPLTTVEYLAAALAQISAGDVSSLAGRTLSAVETWVTGQQLVDAFTQVNGEKPTVLDYTDKDLEDDLTIHAEGLGIVRAGYFLKWKAGSFKYPNEIPVDGWKPFDLVETVRAARGA